MSEIKNQKQNLTFRARRKKRGAAVAAAACFIAAIAIVGTYTFRDFKQSEENEELADARNTQDTAEEPDASETANADQVLNTDAVEESEFDPYALGEGDGGQETGEETEEPEIQAEPATEESAQTTASSESISFGTKDKLLWPVEGKLLMNYSMDKTVYFSTLDQFKYNPALVIQGEKGDQVISSAPGVVKSIDKTAETGTTVNVDIGNGYELFYGQLSDVAVKTGDYVDSKTVLGYVGDPTIYYSVEGTNVYFEMRKDGQPVNPMDYLVE